MSFNRIGCAVLVYQQIDNPKKHRVVYALDKDSEIRSGEKLVSSLDPALWIQHLLNSDDEIEQIEKLYL